MTSYIYKYQLNREPSIESEKKIDLYLPSQSLVNAVNLAIALERPLLLEGEPGCGKTELAKSLAFQLASINNEPDWPFYTWNIKSSTRAKDGLYTFDAVGRLRDSQMVGINRNLDTKLADISAIEDKVSKAGNYVTLGELGKAIESTGKRAVLLIDEIDKGNADLCNDLLYELEKFSFDVPEAPERSFKRPEDLPRPIVILTSNQNKPLPDAFLRRCLYFNIQFPDDDALKRIALKKFVVRKNAEEERLFDRAIEVFNEVRNTMRPPLNRRPSTSEFIDFLKALLLFPEEREAALNNLADHYFLGTLLKTEEDRDLYRREHS